MDIHSSLEIPLVEATLPGAVLQAIDIFERYALETERVKISLQAWSLTDPSVLLIIASHLPKDAGGFEATSGGGKLTAEEFIEAVKSPPIHTHWSYFGNLREHISLGAAMELLHLIVGVKPGMLRKARLSLTFGPLIWKGAPESSEGRISVAQGIKRRTDIYLVVYAACKAGSKKDAAVTAMFAAIAGQTALDFSKGKLDAFKEFRPRPTLNPREKLVAELCYRAAWDAAAKELTAAGIEFGPTEGLMDQLDALSCRIEKRIAGESERVDFPRVVKKFIRENVPLLPLDDGNTDCIRFRRPLTESLDLLVNVDRINFCGLGKAFGLSAGCEITSGRFAGLRWQDDAFKQLSGALSLCWVYGTAAELSVALGQFLQVLNLILPILERAFHKFLDPIPSEMPVELERRPALSAKAALNVALGIAKAWCNQPRFIGLASSGVALGSLVPHVGQDGTLGDAGVWVAAFLSESGSETLHIMVPAVGAIRTSVHVTMSEQFVLERPWMDSDRALALAHKLARNENWDLTNWMASLNLGGWGNDLKWDDRGWAPRWQILFRAPTDRGPQQIFIMFDPETGDDPEIRQG